MKRFIDKCTHKGCGFENLWTSPKVTVTEDAYQLAHCVQNSTWWKRCSCHLQFYCPPLTKVCYFSALLSIGLPPSDGNWATEASFRCLLCLLPSLASMPQQMWARLGHITAEISAAGSPKARSTKIINAYFGQTSQNNVKDLQTLTCKSLQPTQALQNQRQPVGESLDFRARTGFSMVVLKL